jgi:hypothetical protein
MRDLQSMTSSQRDELFDRGYRGLLLSIGGEDYINSRRIGSIRFRTVYSDIARHRRGATQEARTEEP